MIFDVLLAIIFVIWIIMYIKNKKIILALPYLLMSFVTPFYNILDSNLFVKIFGCGCVPSAQTNIFNIDFNANDLRLLVYSVMVILISILGIKFSQKLNSKKTKIIYNTTVIILNILLGMFICKSHIWN